MSSQSDRLQKLVRPQFLGFGSYSARTAVETLDGQKGVPLNEYIKLDANENPYGSSPKVRQTLSKIKDFSVYPDPEQTDLRKLLAGYAGVSPEKIVATNGSNVLLDLICRLFVGPGDSVINCTPTFDIYRFSTQICGGTIVEIPRTENFDIDILGVKAAINESTKLIFLANPNNPTGNLTSEREIKMLLDTGILTVVDEAYFEFSGETVIPLMEKYDNLMIIRTFSKWAGLAGLRAGYGVFPQDIADYLFKIKMPYSINTAVLSAIDASFKDMKNLQKAIKAIVDERERLYTKLQTVEYLKAYPSRANFVLCTLLQGQATDLKQKLQDSGIMVRYFHQPRLQNSIRISVGKREHTDKLLNILRS